METIINEQKPQQQPPSPAFRTLEQKIDELVNGIRGIRDIIWDRRKIIRQQLKEIIQLAQDLSIDDMQLRDMISESCTRMGVSPSWLRKMLPENLKLTKYTRKDYLKRQLQRDQQPLQQQEEETFTALGYLQLLDNDVPVKVTVNVKTKSIEWMEIDRERIQKIMSMSSSGKKTP